MFTIAAIGPSPADNWTRELPTTGGAVTLGRAPENELCVPWDTDISRRHVELKANSHTVHCKVSSGVPNPVCFNGEVVEEFELDAGEFFVIGSTRFFVHRFSSETSGESGLEELSFSRQEMERVNFHDADKRIEILTRLPETILSASNEEDSKRRLLEMILTGIPRSEHASIVTFEGDRSQVLASRSRRDLADTVPLSHRLLRATLERNRTVAHVWRTGDDRSLAYTAAAGVDWAICTLLDSSSEQTQLLYVTGKLHAMVSPGEQQSIEAIRADVRFTELTVEIHRSIRRLQRLERQSASLRQFLPGPVLDALGDEFDPTMLSPRECDVTVMFCDLRGFSKRAEAEADNLSGLLNNVSNALGVMTRAIISHGGVTGDFLGDAALGFWGWPLPDPESPRKACLAALEILRAFQKKTSDENGESFRVGIGIAHGRAVAGKIGTREQVKITVFGPTVNMASRLEGMTKQLGVPVLVDEATATEAQKLLADDEGRIRKLARVVPYGTTQPLTVSQILPSEADYPLLNSEHVSSFEAGVDAFIAGDWEAAYRLLHQLPPEDRAQDFLNKQIVSSGRVAPSDWTGAIHLPAK
ncbi:adenylate/guanylate cyclase domain-containing protein [Calycomorphotria hydatis]|uniref:Adenylate cyclase 1 n=1 Tax=Calycomorphotria hydatis TaxID=2528027 RepID=A0A517T9G4_9PLAN|nr:adenylate/guanylate cyclase domain-containing protein [Calycomorphotria hydatis]QDT65013.1 Adenylate cyclase 1 [Calycomorphotria hydatis]